MSTHIVLLFDVSGYLIRTPSPYTLENAVDHLSKLEPHLAARVELRTYEEVGRERYSLRPEQQDERVTIPAPAPSEEPLRMVGADRGGE